MSSLKIINANIFTPLGREAARGEEMSRIKHIPEACVICEDGTITYAGPMADAPGVRPTRPSTRAARP